MYVLLIDSHSYHPVGMKSFVSPSTSSRRLRPTPRRRRADFGGFSSSKYGGGDSTDFMENPVENGWFGWFHGKPKQEWFKMDDNWGLALWLWRLPIVQEILDIHVLLECKLWTFMTHHRIINDGRIFVKQGISWIIILTLPSYPPCLWISIRETWDDYAKKLPSLGV